MLNNLNLYTLAQAVNATNDKWTAVSYFVSDAVFRKLLQMRSYITYEEYQQAIEQELQNAEREKQKYIEERQEAEREKQLQREQRRTERQLQREQQEQERLQKRQARQARQKLKDWDAFVLKEQREANRLYKLNNPAYQQKSVECTRRYEFDLFLLQGANGDELLKDERYENIKIRPRDLWPGLLEKGMEGLINVLQC